jgi:hypothetical protein
MRTDMHETGTVSIVIRTRMTRYRSTSESHVTAGDLLRHRSIIFGFQGDKETRSRQTKRIVPPSILVVFQLRVAASTEIKP